MFAIYSVEGLQQRDTLEKLLALRVSASNKAKSQTSSDDAERASTNDPSTAPSDTAIRAYRKVLNVDAREKIVHAHQIMTRPVRSIPISESTEAAWRTFTTFDIRQATVVNDHGAIVGMLSTEDLLKAVIIEVSNRNAIIICKRTTFIGLINFHNIDCNLTTPFIACVLFEIDNFHPTPTFHF